MELTAVDVMEGVIATVEEIVVVDDVIVAELELVVPVTAEVVLLCAELVEVESPKLLVVVVIFVI